MSLTGFDDRRNEYINALEQALPAMLPGSSESGVKDVYNAMKYSLLSGGKRVRALLLFGCYSMFSEDFTSAIPFAAAVEMIHAYSLIHDDLPCMDDDDLRRGKPACHIAYGEATALLAGDGLLTLAFETLARPESIERFGADKTLKAIRMLSRAAGAEGMIGGQMLDLANENRDATVYDLMQTDGKKTGELIKCACEIGCLLGGADEKTTGHVLGYASKLGLAFQIRDDILDVEGDTELLGKPTGSDSNKNKTTYVSIYGIDQAKATVSDLTLSAVGALEGTGTDSGFLRMLAENLAGRKY